MKCSVCKGKNEAFTWEYYARGKDENGNQKYICSYCKDELGRAVVESIVAMKIQERKESEE